MRKLFVLLLVAISCIAHSQKVIGYWYGNANVQNGGSANNYLIELVLKQNQSAVQGVLNYYFKNTFRSFQLAGSFSPDSRQLNLYNIPVTYFASNGNMEVDCMMDFTATLRVAKTGSVLNGRFVGKGAYKNTCPEVFFDLKLNKDASNTDSVLNELRHFKEAYQVWRPTASDTLIGATVIARPVVNYVISNQFKERENVVADEITVDSDSLKVDFYDNGEIDGDSISIFYNKELIAFNRILSTKAVHFDIALDSTKEINEISMFADNLGKLPPNTALMLVYDGKKRYEVRLSSTFQKNATVKIRRNKPGGTTSSAATSAGSVNPQ